MRFARCMTSARGHCLNGGKMAHGGCTGPIVAHRIDRKGFLKRFGRAAFLPQWPNVRFSSQLAIVLPSKSPSCEAWKAWHNL